MSDQAPGSAETLFDGSKGGPPSEALFQPRQTVKALRDVAYRNESMAIAELIDNSIDASATRVDVLLEIGPQTLPSGVTVQRVQRIGVFDEGTGMSPEILAKAATYGGRPEETRIGSIGKYGMGLPTASGSQCTKYEVWTHEGGATGLHYVSVDLEAVSRDEIPRVRPEPVEDWPQLWRHRACEDIQQSKRGTLVLWSNIDRITARAGTIFKRLTEHVGRIYRHRIANGNVQVRIAQFTGNAQHAVEDRMVLPIDPLFLMAPSYNPEERWKKEPMFESWASDSSQDHTTQIYQGEHVARVSIHYSVVTPEAAKRDDAQSAGATQRGRFANQLAGVSVVREDRELFLDPSFASFGGTHAPQHRWWGCEVRFGADADEIFGVDSQKQAATKWSAAVHEVLSARRGGQSSLLALADEDGDPNTHTLTDLVVHIESNIQHLFNEAKKRIRNANLQAVTPGGEEGDSSEARALEIAKRAFEGMQPTEADREREQMKPEDRINKLSEYLANSGFTDPDVIAAKLVEAGAGFMFIPKQLTGYTMFDVEPTGAGITVVQLNTAHELYECLQRLEPPSDGKEEYALVALRVALLAWARYTLETTPEKRRELQDIASQWGRVAVRVYRELSGILPTDGDIEE